MEEHLLAGKNLLTLKYCDNLNNSFLSASFPDFENQSKNLDIQELHYNPSKKDLTDARIHHLLAEELKPYKQASLLLFLLQFNYNP